LLGGAVAAGFDGALTQMIGRTANRVFALADKAGAEPGATGTADMRTLEPPGFS
jgi:hypothetical protein